MFNFLMTFLDVTDEKLQEKFKYTLVYGGPVLILYLGLGVLAAQTPEVSSIEVLTPTNYITFLLFAGSLIVASKVLYLTYIHHSTSSD